MGETDRMAYLYVCLKADELTEKSDSMTSAELMEKLEENGIFMTGETERTARAIIDASMKKTIEKGDYELAERIASSFTTADGWPLLSYMKEAIS